MKKLLGAVSLLAILVLTACGSDDDTVVCHLETQGVNTETTIYVEDGYAVRSVTVAREYADGATEEDIEFLRELMGDEIDIEIDGDYIVISYEIDLEEFGDTDPIDEVVDELEADGFDCD